MTLGLATRGYLCRRGGGGAAVYGPGPQLVDAQDLAPGIDASGRVPGIAPPSITGAELAPSIVGANEPPATHPARGPTLVDATQLTPSFTDEDEE